MDELDGNAAAGLLQEIFGREMTVAVATCASCGAVAPIGESGLYRAARERSSAAAAATACSWSSPRYGARYCVDLMGIRALDMPLGNMAPGGA